MSAPVQDPAEDQLTMGIDPYEKNWIRLSILLLVVFFVLVSVAGFAMGFQVPGADAEVDPATVTSEGDFSEPGLREISDGVYEAYIVAQTWSFIPAEIRVPVGAEVTIYVTSPDLQHGFKITDTNINMQVVPGQVSKLTYTFDTPGTYPYICTEYCGTAHAAMWGNVVVEAATTSDADATDTEEASQ